MQINFSSSGSILVIGDVILDHYLKGTTSRISPEAPVQVVKVNSENFLLGGAGNVINNLRSLGAKAEIMSVIGSCVNSSKILELCQKNSISAKHLITDSNKICSKKTRLIASNQQIVRFDEEQNNDIDKDISRTFINDFNLYIKNLIL